MIRRVSEWRIVLRVMALRVVAAAALFSPCFVSLSLAAQEPPTPTSTPAEQTQTPVIPDATVQSAAQAAGVTTPAPLAVVPVEGVQLSGAMQVADGKAMIGSSGSIAAGDKTVAVTLPGKGQLRLCATTRVSLSADKSIAANLGPQETPGLMMALDRGALEADFATGKNSDVILTPDFRITISGPGTASVRVRLGDKGDTCVDNRGPNAPYLTVSGVFDGGVYRVQEGQRVMFEHGSLNEVVDREKESCGCPEDPSSVPPVHATANPFPTAQSAGLAPIQGPPPNADKPGVESAQATATLRYNGDEPKQPEASITAAAPVAPVPATRPAKSSAKPRGFLGHIGHFFKNLFGG